MLESFVCIDDDVLLAEFLNVLMARAQHKSRATVLFV